MRKACEATQHQEPLTDLFRAQPAPEDIPPPIAVECDAPEEPPRVEVPELSPTPSTAEPDARRAGIPRALVAKTVAPHPHDRLSLLHGNAPVHPGQTPLKIPGSQSVP
ncbi:uncharacterized protein M421DRAFT_418685 [Didymella exigua CBS 183.55]|uniref:Uncharacterized protein n=1 Tax=Didymella exigua CBS 183.55 TaxID=1150837 RepID=A0A6A5RYN4_9PLEO|nr:uncharacterized protein M421DRAFT_418685 [Didymella exigua CBS 183.55]KAF1930367.1 hypothetical protein M421DRAFT_418685 [Didymella exigua CBS 183.55]